MCYSGCPSACGEFLIKDIGAVKHRETFAVYAGGKSKTVKAAMGELLLEVSKDRLIPVVHTLTSLHRAHGKRRERFSFFGRRYGLDEMRDKVTQHGEMSKGFILCGCSTAATKSPRLTTGVRGYSINAEKCNEAVIGHAFVSKGSRGFADSPAKD